MSENKKRKPVSKTKIKGSVSLQDLSATSEEVSGSVAHINELSQDLTSRIAEAGERIHEVRTMANHLARLVEQFREG